MVGNFILLKWKVIYLKFNEYFNPTLSIHARCSLIFFGELLHKTLEAYCHHLAAYVTYDNILFFFSKPMKHPVHKRKKLYGFEKEEIFFIVKTFWDVTSFIATTAAVMYSYHLITGQVWYSNGSDKWTATNFAKKWQKLWKSTLRVPVGQSGWRWYHFSCLAFVIKIVSKTTIPGLNLFKLT